LDNEIIETGPAAICEARFFLGAETLPPAHAKWKRDSQRPPGDPRRPPELADERGPPGRGDLLLFNKKNDVLHEKCRVVWLQKLINFRNAIFSVLPLLHQLTTHLGF